MSRFKTSAVLLFALVAVGAAIPGAVLAAHHPRPSVSHVYGSLESINAHTAVITTKRGDISAALEPIVAYVSYDQAAALAGVQVNDQVDASGTYIDGTLHVDRLRYDTVAFPITRLVRFNGLYVATPVAAATTLTIELRRGVNITFNLDANTRYFLNGRRLAGPPTFEANEHIRVWARQFSDQTWLAAVVDAIDHSKA